MKVEVYNAYSEETETFSGTAEQVRDQLNARYGFLARYGHTSLAEDVRKLASCQAYFVKVDADASSEGAKDTGAPEGERKG